MKGQLLLWDYGPKSPLLLEMMLLLITMMVREYYLSMAKN